MFEIKHCDKTGKWYLMYYTHGKKIVLDSSFSKSWINEQYCLCVGGVKQVPSIS